MLMFEVDFRGCEDGLLRDQQHPTLPTSSQFSQT